MAKIAPQEYQMVAVGDLEPYPDNPHHGDVDVVVASIKEPPCSPSANAYSALTTRHPGHPARPRRLDERSRWSDVRRRLTSSISDGFLKAPELGQRPARLTSRGEG